MSEPRITDTLNKKMKKGGRLVTLLIIGLVLAFVAGYTSFLIINHVKTQAAEKFLVAFELIEEFNELNVFSKQELEREIVNKLDEVIVSYGATASAKRALYYKGYVYYNTANYEKATPALERFIKKNKNHELVDKAIYLLAHSKYQMEDIPGAIETLKVYEDNRSDSYFAPSALVAIAQFYEEQQDIENALKYFRMVSEKYEESSKADYASKKAVLLENGIKLYD
jgi:TolA-binding protein